MRRAVGLVAALAALLVAGAAAAKPPVWVVRDKDSEVVLFGSIHVLPPGVKWQPAALVEALRTADDVWFELPLGPDVDAQTAQLATQMGALAPDQSLFKLLPPADAAQLARVAAAYDVSPAVLDRLKPWLAEIAIAAGAYRRAHADAADGVERAASTLAAPTARREAFETPAEQIALLSSGSMDEQIASLRQTMGEMEGRPDEFARLLRAWMAGDVRTLGREALDPLMDASPALYRRLVVERNERWTRLLDARLKGHGRTVVVVGVGHLIGPDSVPARLRALGYSVKGP